MKLQALSLDKIKDTIRDYIQESCEVKEKLYSQCIDVIFAIVEKVLSVLKDGKKIIVFGNGGSASDSQHFAAELVGRFQKERKAFAVLALTTNTSTLTAVANDYSFQDVFRRQLEAFLSPGDLIIALSTSGNSPNVLDAVSYAKACGNFTIAFTGKDGGRLAQLADLSLRVPSCRTSIIQESHIAVIHLICLLVEQLL